MIIDTAHEFLMGVPIGIALVFAGLLLIIGGLIGTFVLSLMALIKWDKKYISESFDV